MDDVTVLITGAGAPGTKGTLYSLEKNYDKRKIKTIGTDIRKNVIGKHLCKKFYEIPPPNNNNFLPILKQICKTEKIDVILPQVTAELEALAAHASEFEKAGTHIALSNHETIKTANNKHKLMQLTQEIGIPTPKFYLAKSLNDLEKNAKTLGYPEKSVVIKPPISHGMIGFRILDAQADKRKAFLTEKPDGTHIKLEELEFLEDTFPEMLVMEYLSGDEYSIDVLSKKAKTLVAVPRRRDTIRTGITFEGTVEEDQTLIDLSRRLIERTGLEYVNGFQFKRDEKGVPKIIECNPRIQGTMALSTLAGANIIYSAIKLALGEELPEFNINWGTRLLRYWGGIGVFNEQLVDEL